MPYKCSVPFCRGNYDAENKVHVFCFPSEDEEKKMWIRTIPRMNFEVTKNSRVCHKHFQPHDIEWFQELFDVKTGTKVHFDLQRPKLRNGAVPSIFPGCPSYLSKKEVSVRESPSAKRQRIEKIAAEEAISESLRTKAAYDASRSFASMKDLRERLLVHQPSEKWNVVYKKENIIFLNMDILKGKFYLNYSVVIDNDLNLRVFFKENELLSIGCYKFPMVVSNVNEIFNVLEFIEINPNDQNHEKKVIDIVITLLKTLKEEINETKESNINFIINQLNLINSKPEKYRYSSETIIFCSLLHLISPAAYRFLRNSGELILPHPSTINKVCGKFQTNPLMDDADLNDVDFLSYAKQRVQSLENHERYVSLMLDEIHIKECYDYKGGNIVGLSYNTLEFANSAHTFMLQSLFSKYKDVVYILPVKKMTADRLFEYAKKIIVQLESFGFRIVLISSDNNSINRKCVSFFNNDLANFVYPHPCDPQRPLFYCVDPVHLLKSVRNSWINQKNNEQALYFPSFDLDSDEIYTASFLDLKNLYDIESGDLLKGGYTLTQKALWPSNIERQNVKLALQVFNENVSVTLKEKGESYKILNFKGTAMFIHIITTWFKILNVKSPRKGHHKKDEMAEPLVFSEADKKMLFLENFVSWLKKWECLNSDTGRLTKETHSALMVTTNCVIELTRYVNSELNMPYLLTGKVQTDALEYRFSLYRRMAGTNYHISLRQIYEVENKLRISNMCKLNLISKSKGTIVVSSDNFFSNDDTVILDDNVDDPNCSQSNTDEKLHFSVNVSDSDINNLKDKLPLLTFLAGYCIHSIAFNKLKCDDCKFNLTIDKSLAISENFKTILNFDRGGLKYPIIEALNIVVHNYIIIQKLITDFEEKFLRLSNQRSVVLRETFNVLASKDMTIVGCEKHNSMKIMTLILRASTNTFLKNYCKEKNDILTKLKNEAKNKKDASNKNDKEAVNKISSKTKEGDVNKNSSKTKEGVINKNDSKSKKRAVSKNNGKSKKVESSNENICTSNDKVAIKKVTNDPAKRKQNKFK